MSKYSRCCLSCPTVDFSQTWRALVYITLPLPATLDVLRVCKGASDWLSEFSLAIGRWRNSYTWRVHVSSIILMCTVIAGLCWRVVVVTRYTHVEQFSLSSREFAGLITLRVGPFVVRTLFLWFVEGWWGKFLGALWHCVQWSALMCVLCTCVAKSVIERALVCQFVVCSFYVVDFLARLLLRGFCLRFSVSDKCLFRISRAVVLSPILLLFL